jgi:predicted transcriptional regulator of viral defense system
MKFYKQRLFRLKEATKIIKNQQVCKNTLKRLMTKNLIKRIRNTIYYIVPLDDHEFYPNKIHIAMNLRDDGIIACQSALYAYTLWKEENTIYILSKNQTSIRIRETSYKIIKNQSAFGIREYEYNTGYAMININITDIERTLIDCLRTKSTKLEDLVSILRQKKIAINIKYIIKYLEKYKKPLLYNKIGLLLDICKNSLDIRDEDLEEIRKKLTKKTFYLKEKGLSLIKPRYKYYQKWNIMIPERLFEMIPKPELSSNPLV